MSLHDLRDLGLRALWTFVQATVAAVLYTGLSDLTISAATLALLAGVSAVFSVVKTFAANALSLSTYSTWLDIIWRFVWTFLTAALGILTTGALHDIAVWEGAAVAGLAAILSLLKSTAGEILVKSSPIIDSNGHGNNPAGVDVNADIINGIDADAGVNARVDTPRNQT